MRNFTRIFSITTMIYSAACASAHAQLISNEPFSFRGAPGGVGISIGGQQAILNKEIFNQHPDNMVRDPAGRLLSVTEGPGESAFVSYPGTGTFIPQFRTSWKSSRQLGAAIAGNNYYQPAIFFSSADSIVAAPSGATVSTWTARVSSGDMPISYLQSNVIDNWTGQVFSF